MGESNANEISRDPLQRLGPSLFLQILSTCPPPTLLSAELVCKTWRDLIKSRSKTIWRSAARLSTIESRHYEQLINIENAFRTSSWSDESGEQIGDISDYGGGVNWREIVRNHIELNRNWKYGRCRERYTCPPGNSVWRLKVDGEQDTVICSDRTGGISVVDNKTSKPLFAIQGVRAFAHLEFARGFMVFDIGHDFSLEVWRTQPAINRSIHKKPKSNSSLSSTAHSYTHPTTFDYKSTTIPLPRGHFQFYRKISPPTPCLAFRARIDHEDIEGKERVVLGTAGEKAVYIWDLEEEGKVETVPIRLNDTERIQDQFSRNNPSTDTQTIESLCPLTHVQYVEFDEEYIFICTSQLVRVYSRLTRKHVTNFAGLEIVPSTSVSRSDNPSLRRIGQQPPYTSIPWYGMDQINRTNLCPRIGVGQRIGTLEDGIPEYQEAWVEKKVHVRKGGRGMTPPSNFSACHYTTNDLYCTTRSNQVIIVRDYKTAFSAPSEDIDQAVASRTLIYDFHHSVELLATYRDRVAFVTSHQIIILDPTTLPTLPVPTDQDQHQNQETKIRSNVILSTRTEGVSMAACCQLDRNNLYLTYWALGEENVGGLIDPYHALNGQVVRRLPPTRATEEFGMCVKVWEFTPWEE